MPYRLTYTKQPALVDDTEFWARKSNPIEMGRGNYQIFEAMDGRTFERHTLDGGNTWYYREEVPPDSFGDEMAGPVYVIYGRFYHFGGDFDQWTPANAFRWQLEDENGKIISSCGDNGEWMAGYPFKTVLECYDSIARHRHKALSPFTANFLNKTTRTIL